MNSGFLQVLRVHKEHTCGCCGKKIKKLSGAFKLPVTLQSETKHIYFHTYCRDKAEESLDAGKEKTSYDKGYLKAKGFFEENILEKLEPDPYTPHEHGSDAHGTALKSKISGKLNEVPCGGMTGSEYLKHYEGSGKPLLWGINDDLVPPDNYSISADDTFAYCGTDPVKWATQFMVNFNQMPSSQNINSAWVVPWFVGAITQARDAGFEEGFREGGINNIKINDKQLQDSYISGKNNGYKEGLSEGLLSNQDQHKMDAWMIFIFSLLVGGVWGYIIHGFIK